jgi:hypothetical protein
LRGRKEETPAQVEGFEVLLGLGWLHQFHPEVLAEAIPGYSVTGPATGGSLWIRRIG